jgi:hypothetical protein
MKRPWGKRLEDRSPKKRKHRVTKRGIMINK